MKRIIINGANGYVASNFIYQLLARNYEVIALVRNSGKRSSLRKMKDALSEINEGEYAIPKNLKVYNYSLHRNDFGMSPDDLKAVFEQDSDYFHFAATLKYDERSKEEILQTNLEGVENSVKVFLKYAGSGSRYFFISTSYSCGNISGPFMEEFYDNDDISGFRNYYEQSKRFAENIIKKHIDANHLNAHILRLSQVIGDSRTGFTKTDYGIFDFAKRVHKLAHRFPGETVRVQVEPHSTQNLIPVDRVVYFFFKIIETNNLPAIINLTAKNSIKNECIINSLCKLLPINLKPVEKLEAADMSSLERIISLGMSFTGSYTNTRLIFDNTNLEKIIGHGNNEVTEEMIFRMLKYFVDELSQKKTQPQTTHKA